MLQHWERSKLKTKKIVHGVTSFGKSQLLPLKASQLANIVKKIRLLSDFQTLCHCSFVGTNALPTRVHALHYQSTH